MGHLSTHPPTRPPAHPHVRCRHKSVAVSVVKSVRRVAGVRGRARPRSRSSVPAGRPSHGTTSAGSSVPIDGCLLAANNSILSGGRNVKNRGENFFVVVSTENSISRWQCLKVARLLSDVRRARLMALFHRLESAVDLYRVLEQMPNKILK